MNQALEIRTLIVLHFGDWEADGVGLGHLLPTDAKDFIELLAMRPIEYKDNYWSVKHSNMEIAAGLPIIRVFFVAATKLTAGQEED
jgi:hypothetical protein